MTAEEQARRRLIFRICKSREELDRWIQAYLHMELPNTIVDEDSNCCPLDMVWYSYQKSLENDEDFSEVMFYASRGGFKTFAAAIIEVLSMLHLGRSVAHLAAVEGQSKKAQSYLKKFLRMPFLRDFLVGDAIRETVVLWFEHPTSGDVLTKKEFEKLSAGEAIDYKPHVAGVAEYEEVSQYVKVLVATLQGVNSEHCPTLVVDEVDVVKNPAVIEEAANIPTPSGDRLPITIYTSSRKFKFGLVQRKIEAAKETGLVVKHWNVIDVTKACPPSRHRPDLPRLPIYRSAELLRAVSKETYEGLTLDEQKTYRLDEGYSGCLSNCKMFAVCKGRLATHQTCTSPLLQPIASVQNKFRYYAKNLEMAKAQLMCWDPTSIGLIYPRFEVGVHVLSPAQAYEKIFGEECPDALIDTPDKILTKSCLMRLVAAREVQHFGGADFGFLHNFAYVHGIKDIDTLFITHCVGGPGLEADHMMQVMEPFTAWNPVIYPDMSAPISIRILRKRFRAPDWPKGAGSILGGISAVQGKLWPVFADEPELYFVHDSGADPGMDLLIQRVQEYHWKLDAANQPTNIPDDKDDDELDALRYLVQNACPVSAGAGMRVNTGPASSQDDPEQAVRYDPNNWMRQAIAERTGEPLRTGMTVTNLDGTDFYADPSGRGQAAPAANRGILFDLDD